MINTQQALKVFGRCGLLFLTALYGVLIALIADLAPTWLRLPSRAWWQYHRACILAIVFGFSVGVNLAGAASVAYALT